MKTLKVSGLLFFILLLIHGNSIEAPVSLNQNIEKEVGCAIPNTAFKSGENVGFDIYYSVGKLINVHAGKGSFTTTLEKLNGHQTYHIVAQGSTLSSYEWFYKARDVYETYMDVETLQPVKFIRNVHEGDSKKYQYINFNNDNNTAQTADGTYRMPECVHDVVSSVFYARNIDYNKLKVNDRVSFTMFLGNQLYKMYIRYLGKEVISTKYGKFNTIKIKPLTIKGDVFHGGEKMTIWITDDANHVPVRAESPIIVGSVKIDMTSFQNLRSPMSALLGKR